MSQAIPVSDETYHTLEALARQQGTTPEHIVEMLVKERLQREAVARQNAEWEAGLDEALAQVARGETRHFESTEELFAYLDSIPPVKTSEE